MVIVIGASSLHQSLEKWSKIKARLSKKVITKRGYNLHAEAKDKSKIVQRAKIYPRKEGVILWHDIINNSLTRPESDPRIPLSANELVKEIQKFGRVVGIVYTVRAGALDVYKKLKATGIPVLHIVKDLLSKRKQKNKRLIKKYAKLHLNPFLEIKTLSIIRKYNSDLKKIIKKKQSPSKKQRAKNRLKSTK